MNFLYGETWTRLRPATADRFGDIAGDPGELVITGCAFSPRGTPTETLGAQDTIVDSDTLYAPYGADILPTDQMRSPADVVYEVDGPPSPYRSPFTGTEFWTVVVLKKVLG